jgi:cystathionine beta-lyase
LGFQTDCTTTGESRERFHGSIPPPIYETSLFTFPTYDEFREASSGDLTGDGDTWIYSRVGNPTVRVLERKLALLERGDDARVFSSGMAAITAAVLSAARGGGHVVAVRSIYSNAHRLLAEYLPTLGIETSFADFTEVDEVAAAIRPDSRALYLESPGNPAMHLIDLPAIVDLARDRGLTTIVDNTMATPYNQRPLEMGVDLCVHSATKYLSGHSDVVAGAVIGGANALQSLAANEVRDLGSALAPFESWLVLRGVRSLGVRMKAHNESGMRVAQWLEEHPRVLRVLYPGLPSHPQYALAMRQMTGFSGMLSIVVPGGLAGAARVVDRLTLFGIGVSWGGFESLALPIDPASTAFAADLEIVPGMIRLSIGLEDVDDLLADLDQALEGAAHD